MFWQPTEIGYGIAERTAPYLVVTQGQCDETCGHSVRIPQMRRDDLIIDREKKFAGTFRLSASHASIDDQQFCDYIPVLDGIGQKRFRLIIFAFIDQRACMATTVGVSAESTIALSKSFCALVILQRSKLASATAPAKPSGSLASA